jgi:RNA polymerase sigma-70 factor (ECF subfamily)
MAVFIQAVIDKQKYRKLSMAIPESGTISLIPSSESTFEELFTTHFKRLYAYAYTIVKDEVIAEEMVQNVFVKIWEKKGMLDDIHTSIGAYLYKSVYHESLNHLKHMKVRSAYTTHASRQKPDAENSSSRVQLSELQQKLDIALKELPEQCRTIFQMSRFEELKYQEIADKLGLSIKTVENQMGKALRILRLKLADYLPLIGLLLAQSMNDIPFC